MDDPSREMWLGYGQSDAFRVRVGVVVQMPTSAVATDWRDQMHTKAFQSVLEIP